jgi:hypothetical protein
MLQTEAYLTIVITIVIYDRKAFIIEANKPNVIILFTAVILNELEYLCSAGKARSGIL